MEIQPQVELYYLHVMEKYRGETGSPLSPSLSSVFPCVDLYFRRFFSPLVAKNGSDITKFV